MTEAEYLAILCTAAEAGDVQAIAMLRMMESRKPEPFAGFPSGL